MEFAGADVVAAAEGRQDAAGLQHLQRAQMDLLVAAHGVADARLGLGERGRVEDDQVVGGAGRFLLLEEIEAVGGDEPDLGAGEVGVFLRQGDGVVADVDGGDVGGAG